MSQTLANMIHSSVSHLMMPEPESNSSLTFFEGVEKLLEVWFSRKDGLTLNCDLRKIPRSQLEVIMQVVKCEIISFSSSDDLDAYVLSESSMFISSRRFILKTCGTTTPLMCLPLLVSLVQEYAGYDAVQDLYYSRKNFKRPELQVTPHRTFEEEAALLDQFFPGRGGRAYCMGSLNGEDCWYLYTVSPGRPQKKELFARQNLPHSRSSSSLTHKLLTLCLVGKIRSEPDQTLEILMTDLDPKKMACFYKKNCPTASEATKISGIDKLIPGVIIDDFQFEPCGYSMNGIIRSVPGGYMTIHITPEPAFSYVSFETNIPQKSYKDLIYRVVKIFDPKQFVITFFSGESTNTSIGLEEERNGVPEYLDYYVEDIQICRLPGYDLTYALYTRYPS